jgi:hypothetical protein
MVPKETIDLAMRAVTADHQTRAPNPTVATASPFVAANE